MIKFVSKFFVLALISAGAALPTFARESKAAKKYSMPAPPSVDAVKMNTKIVEGFSHPASLEIQKHKSAPCDSHMNGCADHDNGY